MCPEQLLEFQQFAFSLLLDFQHIAVGLCPLIAGISALCRCTVAGISAMCNILLEFQQCALHFLISNCRLQRVIHALQCVKIRQISFPPLRIYFPFLKQSYPCYAIYIDAFVYFYHFLGPNCCCLISNRRFQCVIHVSRCYE
jgi:hypothetical protein